MKGLKCAVTIVVALLYYLVYYLFLPTLSFAYFDGFLFLSVGVILSIVLIGLWIGNGNEVDAVCSALLGGVVIFAIILAGGTLIGSSIFNDSTMYSQIGTIEEKSFQDDIIEIDTSQIPVVDVELAAKLADKKLGEDIGLGSQMQVGEFTNKQQVNGKLLYVAPLEHSGFWKWNSNRVTTGYIVVSATNPNDVRFVREVDGKPLKLMYLNNSFFGTNLKRHIRNSGYRNVGLTEYSFELDDNGYPYWVVTTFRNTTLWGNHEATGVVVCDPQTGDCEWYPVAGAPEWIDIIQPEDFIVEQLKHYGQYVHGWWLHNLDKKDMLSVTEHITTVYNNGDCYYCTGMSSVGADNGTVGFVLVNTRDKSTKMYKMSGATEEAAMKSSEGKVQHMGYKATTPIPLNVSGVPTYYNTLKDDEGLVKMHSMVNIIDYSIVGVGETVAEAKRNYLNAVNNSGTTANFGGEVYGYELTGTVTRIGYNIESGETYYYMILNNDESKLYTASYMVSEELPITREGDTVEISYIDESNGTINIVEFDNVKFAQAISEAQQRINEEQKSQNIINNPDNKITKVDPEANEAALEEWINSMTDEERAKFLKELQKEK